MKPEKRPLSQRAESEDPAQKPNKTWTSFPRKQNMGELTPTLELLRPSTSKLADRGGLAVDTESIDQLIREKALANGKAEQEAEKPSQK